MAPNREKQIVHTSSREAFVEKCKFVFGAFFREKSEIFISFHKYYLCYSMGKSFAFIGMCKFNNLLPTEKYNLFSFL